MNEVFVEKGNMMRDMLSKRLGDERGPVTIDLSSWFRQVTLDIIGQTGFGYQFQALQTHGKEEAELSTVLRQLFHSPKANLYRSIQMAQIVVPALKLLPLPGSYVTLVAQTRLRAIGKTLLNDSKAESAAISDAKQFNRGRDLLSLLIKANMSNEIPTSQRLSDDEVIAQIATFVFAGHETTSTALSWAAHALSRNPDIQEKLRQELLSLPTDNPSMDELNSLPFLENFVRETMRLYAPVAFTQRMASQDDVLPLTKPYVDCYGVSHEVLPIRKGQIITIPILAINTDIETWGEDALEFQPERWDNLPDAANLIPGIWAHQMTFLAGPHNCIGFRFTLVEQKAILFSLLRAFEFSPGAKRVEPVLSGPLQRPVSFVPGKSGSVSTGTLPITVSAYNAEL
ncbi:unnamed protein product [Mycena citricolor]|uniref:Cytochrome P450 n=1 Tax=Mycena citricolor TaxID=2018698 RepID=A0AAD2H9T8_9AGAR|nr:unnamed protein product [Mycena citricolor]